MAWKHIIESAGNALKKPNSNPNSLHPLRRDLHPTDEESLRTHHSELLSIEDRFLSTRKSLAETIEDMGYARAAQLIGMNDPIALGSNLKRFVKAGLGNLRPSLPRFDWQENCQSCARPLNIPDDQLTTVGRLRKTPKPGRKLPQLTQDKIDDFYVKMKDFTDTQRELHKKSVYFGHLIKRVGQSASSRLFNRSEQSMYMWIKSVHNKGLGRGIGSFLPTQNGDCPVCERPINLDEPVKEVEDA